MPSWAYKTFKPRKLPEKTVSQRGKRLRIRRGGRWYRSAEDYRQANQYLQTIVPFLLEETESLLKSKGWNIAKKASVRSSGVLDPLFNIDCGNLHFSLDLNNAIGEILFVDRDADVLDART